MACSFFFADTKQEIARKFADLYKPSSKRYLEVAAGAEQLEQTYGYYLTLKRIAESPALLDPSLPPIRAAELVPLYMAFTYLSAENAQTGYENRYFEESQKRNK